MGSISPDKVWVAAQEEPELSYREIMLSRLHYHLAICNFNLSTGKELPINKEGAELAEALQFAINELENTVNYIEADFIEVRDNGYDYPTTKFICSKCDTECYEEDNFCSHCGSKFTGDVRYIAESKCKLCTYSETGLEADCTFSKWYPDRGHCKYDAAPHWVRLGPTSGKCSKCGYIVQSPSKYCPDCGSKMRFEND